MHDLSAQQFSHLVGHIYDCALEPERWPSAMQAICDVLGCIAGQLYVVDITTNEFRFARTWNEQPEATAAAGGQFKEVSGELNRRALLYRSKDPDEPLVLQRVPGIAEILDDPKYLEISAILGYCDTINVVVLEDGNRFGMIGAARPVSAGFITDREIALMRLLAPHLRRAVAIGDLLDMKTFDIHVMASALDAVAAGICIVGEGRKILRLNAAARGMIEVGAPIRSRNGFLVGLSSAETKALHVAVALAARPDEVQLGRKGIGIALSGADGALATAYVLPLAGQSLRASLQPGAVAAIFVAQATQRQTRDLSAVALTLGLTPAEARLLSSLMAGGTSLVGIAGELGLGLPTVKTQLANLFIKAGVSRQADLVALVDQLTPLG